MERFWGEMKGGELMRRNRFWRDSVRESSGESSERQRERDQKRFRRGLLREYLRRNAGEKVTKRFQTRVTNRLQVECQGFGGRVLQGLQRKQPDEIQESNLER